MFDERLERPGPELVALYLAMIGVWVVPLGLLAAADPPREEPEFKTSLETKSAEELWLEPGLRVGLGYAADNVYGAGGTPGGLHHSAVLRIGPRLDEHWSLLGTFRYGAHLGTHPGLRFGATIEPTLHLTSGLSLAIGAGIGGFVIASTGAPTPNPNVVASYTLPDTERLLGECQGAGWLALLRAEYIFFASSLFATGPALQADAQWTECTQELGRSDPDTGQPINLTQYWRSYGLSLAWMFWWR